MTAHSEAQLLQQLGGLSLGAPHQGALHEQGGHTQGAQQAGANLLQLLKQGGGNAQPPPNGYQPQLFGQGRAAAPPAQPPPAAQQQASPPDQAFGSLFGAGGSIWSSGGGGQGPSLWAGPPPPGGWAGQQPPPPQPPGPHHQQPHEQQPQPQHQQQHAQLLGMLQQAGPLPPGMLQQQLGPPQPGMPQQQSRPPYQPPMHFGGPPHLPPPQHPSLAAPQQQQGQLQQLQHQQQQHPQQQQGQHSPVAGYSPLAALLQHSGMPPPPPGMQHQQHQQQQVHPGMQHQQQQQQQPHPGMQLGGWGPGAMFAGLPAMQQQQQQDQQPHRLSSPPLGAGQASLQHQHQLQAPPPGFGLQRHSPPPPGYGQQRLASPPPGYGQQRLASPPPGFGPAGLAHSQQLQPGASSLLEGMLRAAAATQQQAHGGAGASSPPPLPHGGEAGRQVRPVGLLRKPGTQHVPKPVTGRENRWVDVMDRQHDGRQPKADMAQLDAALTQIADSLMPTPEEKEAQRQAFDAVASLLQARWPGARVHLFGSVANGLSVRHNNDIDVCLELEELLGLGEEDALAAKGEVAVAVGELMEAAGMAEVLPLPKARVPVVKFVVPRTGTKVDVTVNNVLACINTKLLADYCAIDARLARLVALVKHWAKRRAVNDPYRGTLSSYCYVLMCIHLLQSRPTPVLPVLQQLPATFRRTVGQWACEFCDDVASLRSFGAANGESLAQLLWAFFEYWAWRHNYSHDVVSVRLGGCLHKDDKDWTRRIGNERHLVCIEDPFELSHDLGRTVDRQTRAVLHKEFTRAATLLRDADDPIEAGLFAPYKAGRS